MTSVDERIIDALRSEAPAAYDPVFRLGVLERRERQRFRRRLISSVAAGFVLALVSVLTVAVGGDAYNVGSVLLFAFVLVVGVIVHLPAFGRLLQHLSLTRS